VWSVLVSVFVRVWCWILVYVSCLSLCDVFDVWCYIVYYILHIYTYIYIYYYILYYILLFLYLILYSPSPPLPFIFPYSLPLSNLSSTPQIPSSTNPPVSLIHSIRVWSSRSIFIHLRTTHLNHPKLTPHVLSEWMVEV
jgi:hypothetical protein